MSQTLSNLVALFRSFGSGVDMFDAPEDAFHAVIDAIRAELEPNSILMFLSIETLIRSLKNQRLPAVRSVHDSRWQRDRACGERMMYRTMNQLIKLTQPPKTPRAAKAALKPLAPSNPAVEPNLDSPIPNPPSDSDLPNALSSPLPSAEPDTRPAEVAPAVATEFIASAPIANLSEVPEQWSNAEILVAGDADPLTLDHPLTASPASTPLPQSLDNFEPACVPPPATSLPNCTSVPDSP